MIDLKIRTNVNLLVSYQLWKAVLDRISALVMLVLLSPFLLLIALGIVLDSPGNPIFSQERVGKGGRRFVAYKYRTMKPNNDDTVYRSYIRQYVQKNAPYRVDENGEKVFKVVNDPRVTRFGGLLRKTNLDELPQLINILKGEMSLIGPRPDIPFAVNMYQDWHRRRLNVTPGVTGLWQVYGRKSLSFEEMVELDLDYIENQSPLLDAKILLKTVRVVLTGDGS